jgi:hypothetical protein
MSVDLIAELVGFTVRPLCRSGHSPAPRVTKHSQWVRQSLFCPHRPHSETFRGLHSETCALFAAQELRKIERSSALRGDAFAW